MFKLNFVGGDYNSRNPKNSAQRCLNYYPERSEGLSKENIIYIQCAGSEIYLDLRNDFSSPCRGIYYTSTGRLFFVFGNKLLEETTGGYTERATLSAGGNNISFADNGYYLLFVDGTQMYFLKLNDNTSGTVSLPFTNPTRIIFYEQRFFAINTDPTALEDPEQVPENNKFYWSDLGPSGAISWDALSFASAELSADPLIGIEVASGNLWLIGSQSFEVWAGSSNPDLPVTRFGGSASNIGTNAPDSIAEINDRICWLGSSKSGFNQVFVSNGYGAERISNHAIEFQISQFSTTSEAVGFTYQQEGHVFYVLTFASGNKTFVYDFTEGLWHERSTQQNGFENRWDVRFVVQTDTDLVFGNNSDSVLLRLNLDKFDEWDGREIIRELVGTAVWNNSERVFHKKLVVDVDAQAQQVEDNPLNYPFSASGNDVTLAGNFLGVFKVGDVFQIQGSTSNDGYYTILSLSFTSPSTILTIGDTLVTESDGTLSKVAPQDPQMVMKFSDDGRNYTHDQIRSVGKIGAFDTRVSWVYLGNSRERVYQFNFSDNAKCNVLGVYLDVSTGVK